MLVAPNAFGATNFHFKVYTVTLTATVGLCLFSCSPATTDTERETGQETRIKTLEAEVIALREAIGRLQGKPLGTNMLSPDSAQADAPPDDVVHRKLSEWQDLFGGQRPISFQRGNIVFAVSSTIPRDAPIFPIRAELPDGRRFELCLFKDNYREWKSFPKGHLDAGLR